MGLVKMTKFFWLVVLAILAILKNMKVNESQWEGLYIPYILWKIIQMFETTNQSLSFIATPIAGTKR